MNAGYQHSNDLAVENSRHSHHRLASKPSEEVHISQKFVHISQDILMRTAMHRVGIQQRRNSTIHACLAFFTQLG